MGGEKGSARCSVNWGCHLIYATALCCALCVFLCVCVCLLLQDLIQSCLRVFGGDIGGHVLRETTSRGLCGLVCPSRTERVFITAGPYKAVCRGGGGILEDMCYERRRAEAYVD